MVRRPQDYPWSSYRTIIGRVKGPDWLETRGLLSYFALTGSFHGKGTKKEAMKHYREYVEEVDVEGVENPSRQSVGGFIVGGSDFVKWIKETFLAGRRDEKEIPQLKALRPRIAVETILEAVCTEFDCGEEQIVAKGQKRNRAREVAISFSRSHSGVSCEDLGKFFGGISGAAITKRCDALSKRLATDKRLRNKMERIERQIVNI